MKNALLSIICLLPFVLFSQATDIKKKVLMVVSSYGKDMGSVRPGYWKLLKFLSLLSLLYSS